MADWLAMGGHGVFVWGSYGATALVLIGLCAWIGRGYLTARRAAHRADQ